MQEQVQTVPVRYVLQQVPPCTCIGARVKKIAVAVGGAGGDGTEGGGAEGGNNGKSLTGYPGGDGGKSGTTGTSDWRRRWCNQLQCMNQDK